MHSRSDLQLFLDALYMENRGWVCQSFVTSVNPAFRAFKAFSLGKSTSVIKVANPVQVAWQSSGLAYFTPADAPVLAIIAATTPNGPNSSVTASASSVSRPPSLIPATSTGGFTQGNPTAGHHRSLNAGAKAGIYVGVGIPAIIIIAVVVAGIFRHGRKRTKEVQKDSLYVDSKPELPGQTAREAAPEATELDPGGEIAEGADTGRPPEAGGNVRAELEGNRRGVEAPSHRDSGHV